MPGRNHHTSSDLLSRGRGTQHPLSSTGPEDKSLVGSVHNPKQTNTRTPAYHIPHELAVPNENNSASSSQPLSTAERLLAELIPAVSENKTNDSLATGYCTPSEWHSTRYSHGNPLPAHQSMREGFSNEGEYHALLEEFNLINEGPILTDSSMENETRTRPHPLRCTIYDNLTPSSGFSPMECSDDVGAVLHQQGPSPDCTQSSSDESDGVSAYEPSVMELPNATELVQPSEEERNTEEYAISELELMSWDSLIIGTLRWHSVAASPLVYSL